jgi:hypothetical protein
MQVEDLDPNDPSILEPDRYDRISDERIEKFRDAISPLEGIQLPVLKIPKDAMIGFEPSQIGTITGTLIDACLPQLEEILPSHDLLDRMGLNKHEGILGEREGYPDYRHDSGVRAELKLLYVDPPEHIEMKSPPTPREASARLTQKVTLKNVDPSNDVLMVLAYQHQLNQDDPDLVSPKIIDIGLFPMIDCILARDQRLLDRGRWFGNFETPAILSKIGKKKKKKGEELDTSTYGRKASEGKDFNEDTNFGKLKRIPYKPLQLFLGRNGQKYRTTGKYPEPWRIDEDPQQHDLFEE